MTLVKKIKDKKVNFEFNKEFIKVVTDKIANNDALFIINSFKEMHPADAADIIEHLSENDRESLIKLNSFKIDPEVFVELNESVQTEIIKFLSFSSTFSKIAIASSDSRFFNIRTIASEERNLIISDCTDSFNSTKTSGSILKLFNLIKFSLSFSLKCSIMSAASAGCISLKEFVINNASFNAILSVTTFIYSLLNSKLTFLSLIFFIKVINTPII